MSIADTIFLKFHIKLKALNYQNLRKSNFPDELDFSGEKPKKFLKNRGFFWLFPKIRSFDVSFFTLKMEHYKGVYDSLKAFCLGKAWSQNDAKPIRLQDSLIINISGRNKLMSKKVAFETNTFGWVRQDVSLI